VHRDSSRMWLEGLDDNDYSIYTPLSKRGKTNSLYAVAIMNKKTPMDHIDLDFENIQALLIFIFPRVDASQYVGVCSFFCLTPERGLAMAALL
jgi:hypothetical protein